MCDEDKIDEKLQYLKEEILDENYDKEKFIKFCLMKKENGNDIDNWTLNELKEVVKEFIILDKNEKDDYQLIKGLNNFKIDEFKNLEREILCRKLMKSFLTEKNIIIKVCNPREKDGTVLGKNYVLYEVKTDQYYWEVYRTYEDFVDLRNLLIKYFPHHYIPPLPKENNTEKQFENYFIMKRMKVLNIFINKLMENEEFKAFEVLEFFLSYKDRKKYENKIKEYQNEVLSTNVTDYRTLDGKLKISISESNEKYFENIRKYFKLQDEIMGKLNLSLKNYFNSLYNVCDHLKDVQKNFEILVELNKRVLMKPIITESFETLKVFFKNWRIILIKTNDSIQRNLKDFFKQIRIEGKAYNELIEKREELKNKCASQNISLLQKKEKLFSTGDINKFEIGNLSLVDNKRLLSDKKYAFEYMCNDDNLNLKKMYYQLGYANKMNMVELKKIIKENCCRYVKTIETLSNELCPVINDEIGNWSNLMVFVESSNKNLTQQMEEVEEYLEK